jgi:hypothetical protein
MVYSVAQVEHFCSFLPPGVRDKIRTFDLRISSRMVDHCAIGAGRPLCHKSITDVRAFYDIITRASTIKLFYGLAGAYFKGRHLALPGNIRLALFTTL